MSLFVASLNSGSNGNCYYIGNSHEAVLIDAGISCREIEKRMAHIGLNMQLVKAVFISHEHIDHVRGLDVLARKHKLQVYITNPTLNQCPFYIDKSSAINFTANKGVSIGNLTVIPFSKQHDAVDPFSFVIESNGVKVGVITDVGMACKNVIHYFKQCHAAFLESNYDTHMLMHGNYPYRLKKRIDGIKGHLSNNDALQLFLQHRPTYMSHLFLSHLSRENNNPQLVHDLFAPHAGHVKITVASRYEPTEVVEIINTEKKITATKPRTVISKHQQLNLFSETNG